MSIRRAPSEVRRTFTLIPNVTINDERLSWEATGLLIYLLSKPDHWVISPSHLMNQRSAGRHRIYKILKELEDAGYIRSEGVRDGGRFSGVDRVLYDMSDSISESPKPEPAPEPVAKKAPRQRKPDLLFEAVIEACGIDASRMTASARGSINRAVKELREAGADPESIMPAARNYQSRYANAALTPAALAKHYPALATLSATAPAAKQDETRKPCPDCERSGWITEDIESKTVVQCGRCDGRGFLSV